MERTSGDPLAYPLLKQAQLDEVAKTFVKFCVSSKDEDLPPLQAPVPIIDRLIFAVNEFMSLALNNTLLTSSFCSS